MKEIEFSIMEDSTEDVGILQPILEEFEAQYHIHVRLTCISWRTGWSEIIKYGLNSFGPDVSEIGTTWIGSLAVMNALRPFSDAEVKTLGGAEAFFEGVWKTGYLPAIPSPWAIPWASDAVVIYYRYEHLEKAGIDPAQAFSTQANFVQALEQLQQGGIIHPLGLTTRNHNMLLHEASSWIWEAGGDFVNPDGKEAIFNQDKAMAGWRKYFGLRRFVPATPRAMGDNTVLELLKSGDVPVVLGGPLVPLAEREDLLKHQEIGVATVPGVPYIGGTSFVIWKHAHQQQEAVELVRFLSARPYRQLNRLLPARVVDLLDIDNNPTLAFFKQSLNTGRSFPTLRLWSLIEDSLNQALADAWADNFASPEQPVDNLLQPRLDILARRLNIRLGSG